MASANESGWNLEQTVESVLRMFDFQFRRQFNTGINNGRGVIRTDFRVRASLFGCDVFHIECKRQNASGSAIDKLAMTKDNAIDINEPIMVVASGEQLPAMIDYLIKRKQEDRRLDSLLCVKSLGEFFEWCYENKNGFCPVDNSPSLFDKAAFRYQG